MYEDIVVLCRLAVQCCHSESIPCLLLWYAHISIQTKRLLPTLWGLIRQKRVKISLSLPYLNMLQCRTPQSYQTHYSLTKPRIGMRPFEQGRLYIVRDVFYLLTLYLIYSLRYILYPVSNINVVLGSWTYLSLFVNLIFTNLQIVLEISLVLLNQAGIIF